MGAKCVRPEAQQSDFNKEIDNLAAAARENDAFIDRISKIMPTKKVRLSTTIVLKRNIGSSKLIAEELADTEENSIDATDFYANWSPEQTATFFQGPEVNLFDNIDYTIGSFADLARINSSLGLAISKYRFLDIKVIRPILPEFKHNLQTVKGLLSEIEQNLVNSDMGPALSAVEEYFKYLILVEKGKELIFDENTVRGRGINVSASRKEIIHLEPRQNSAVSTKQSFSSGKHLMTILYKSVLPNCEKYGHLFVGVHGYPILSTEDPRSLCCFGISVNLIGGKQPIEWIGGTLRHSDQYYVPLGAKINLLLDCDAKKLTISYGPRFTPIWTITFELPHNGQLPWFFHVCSHSVNCELL